MNNSVSRYNMLLSVCLFILGVLSVLWVLNMREMRQLQRDGARLQVTQQARMPLLNQLVAEVSAYSEKHPDIDPILIGMGIKQAKTPATPALKK